MTQKRNTDGQNEVSTAPDYTQYNTKLAQRAKLGKVAEIAESAEIAEPAEIAESAESAQLAELADTAETRQLAELAKISEAVFARRPENDVDFKLDRVYEVLHLLNDPHERVKCVHIAGTNGKSSTTLMTERLLRYAGLSTGCFTSPHIKNVTERILIDGREVSASVFIDAYKSVIKATQEIEKTRPELGKLGFFEVMTIIAFHIFASFWLDICVIEVGLGGLLDATNVIDAPICSIITPIGIDHTDYLGKTIQEIALQKAGIIKESVPVIVAKQCDEVMEVVRQVAKEKCAEVIMPHHCEKMQAVIEGAAVESANYYTPQFIKDNLSLSLQAACIATGEGGGAASATNAANADILGRILCWHYQQITRVSGRFEQQTINCGGKKYRLIYDVAHNPHGASMLRSTIDNYSITYNPRKIYIVVAMFADKDAEGFFKALGGQFAGVKAHYIVTQNSSPRTLSAGELAVKLRCALGADTTGHTVRGTVGEALDYAIQNASQDDIILITGSFTTVSDAKYYAS